jgi:PAS domain S-box-containing protein
MTKIMIVDDNREDRYMLQALLQGSGYVVVSAVNGVEALEKARRERFDMIISDILMPRMDGFQLSRECKKDDKLKDIPFVFYTATYTDEKDEELALSLGAAKFIVKPQEPEVFVEILRNVIGEHEEGKLLALKPPIEEETIYLKEYNERLVKKLEDMMLELEEANKALQKQYEEIKTLKEFNEKIVQTMQDGVVLEDENGVITYLNPQAEKMLGYDKEELIGEHWSKIVSKRFLKKVEKETMTRPQGFQSRYECEIVTKSGDVVPIINSATPLFEEGEFTGVLSVFTDIREQKEREEKLRKKLMKYRLDWGRMYYADEPRPKLALDAFLDLLGLGYPGAAIARLPPDELRDKIQGRAPVLWLSEKAHKLSIAPEFSVLVDKIEDLLTTRKVILFQGLEYLVSKHGYDNTLEFLQGLNELVYIENAVLLLSFDSKALSGQQLELLKKEARRLVLKREAEMPEKYLSLLRFVYERNSAGVKPSHSDVCKHFEITRNTARARIKYLAARGLLDEKLKGRSKVLELTELGKDYF